MTRPRVHCELAPILVNRTAVYRMCKAVPGELARRGFHVRCSALLGTLCPRKVEPRNALEWRGYNLSQRLLAFAVHHPDAFLKWRRLIDWVPRRRAGTATRLFLDPLYPLFHGDPGRGVVVAYDITPATEPSWHPGAVGRLYEAAYDLLARSRCHVVASCRNTADQLRVNWGIAPSRLTVLPLGLFDFPEPKPDRFVEEPFFLFVGTLEPRKNVLGLLRAYATSGLYGSHGIRLRLIGDVPGHDHAAARLARTTPGVDLLGFVPEEELAAAYAGCLAFVYPSFCEGFGLPLLEAMHRGCVCLSTVTGASPEVAGDAALYANPFDPRDIAAGLRRLAALTPAERLDLSTRARERARHFTWSHFYEGLAHVLRSVSAEA